MIKKTIKFLYNILKDKNKMEFYRLYLKFRDQKRYKEKKNVKFLNYKFDVPDLLSFIYQFREIFVKEIYKFNCQNQKPIIFDCGANIGMSCLYFKKIFPQAKIKAFEADPIITEILKSNLIKNGINDIEIINKAVWIDYNGIEFGIDGADAGSIFLNNNKKKVESIRLKDFLEKEEKIDLLKIDIEGAEYDVLMDCENSLFNVKNIFLEYHSWNNHCQKLSEILKILEKNNFRYYIESIGKREQPFINNGKDKNMDLQLNIFGIKNV